MRRFLLRLPSYLPSVVVLIILFYLTLVPKPLPEVTPPFFNFDKVVHIVMMMGVYLTFAFDCARKNQHRDLSLRAKWVLLVITIALGGFIELAQGTSIIHRGCDMGDFVADAIGAIIGLAVSGKIIYAIVK